jgi:alpha-glucosidase
MRTKKGRSILMFIVALQSAAIFTATAQYTKTAHGILVKTDNRQVELAVAKTGAFRLSFNDSIAPVAIPSVFIDESENTYAPFTVISAAPSYGIKTAYGKLMINTNTRQWSVYDAAGKALVADGVYTAGSSSQQITYTAGGLFYGSGNRSNKKLEKDHSNSYLGNGVADVPYFWNTKGYSTLGVTGDDTKPATWASAKNNGEITWKFPGKAADLYIWPAKTMYDAERGLITLTGRPKLPPKWAFGYMQSRWGWKDSTDIADVLNKFRTHNLPVDAFIFDFEWFTKDADYSVQKEGKAGYTDFTFNPKLFPNPAKQIAEYNKQGVKFIGIRKPRLGNNILLDSARKNGWLIRPTSNSRDLDYSKADLRKWYAEKNKPLLDAGVAGWWNDEGESYYTCYYWWNKAQFDLLASVKPNYRHFTLNRAFTPGNQRFGYSTWSGDIQSTWPSLLQVPGDLLNYSLAGMYYGACDIGGFTGTPTKENLVRWFQAGVFLPIMRSHNNNSVKPRFPFLWDDDGEAAIRKALDLRYQLLPYIYSLGHEAYNTGAPIMRPLVMEFPADTTVANMTDEWLVGKGVLAAPLLNAGGTRNIYLPKDKWYDFNTGEVMQGPKTIAVTKALDEIPVYVRAGTILPVGPVIQHSEEVTGAPLEIRVYPGKNGIFKMTEDDGVSYNYIKGNTRVTTYTWNDAAKTLTWKVTGTYTDGKIFKSIKAVLGKQQKTLLLHNSGSVIFK